MNETHLSNWCYVSGVVAVRETTLLGREFFEDVIRATEPAYLRDIFARTPYVNYLTTSPTRARYLESLRRLLEDESAYLEQISPEPGPFLWQRFHSRFKEMRSSLSIERSPDEEKLLLREAMKGLSSFLLGEEAPPALASHFERIEDPSLFKTTRSAGVSNLLDSAALSLLTEWRKTLRSQTIESYIEEFIAIRTGQAIYRALLRGASPSDIDRFFLIGCLENRDASIWLRTGAGEPRNVFIIYLPHDLWKRMEELPKEEFEERLEVEADNILMDVLSEARRTPFGPEKVFGYLVALETQNLNMRLALASAIDGVDREAVRRRLREVYV